jgi:hypothetical protein
VLIVASLAVGILLGTVVTLASSALLYGRTLLFTHTFNPDVNTMLFLISLSVLLCALINLPSLPLLLKLGYSRGKLIGFYLPSFGMMGLVALTLTLMNHVETFGAFLFSAIQRALDNIVWTSAILLLAAAAIFAISYVLSQRVYAKREF